MQSSSTRKIKLQRDISRATDAAKKTALQDELNAQQTNYDAARMSARRLLTSAIRLADEETEAGEVAKVRYYLTYVHYQGNEHQEVIKVGQKALAGEVEDVMGQSIAKIMLASHLNLFRLAANDMQRDLQRQQLQQLAKQLTGRWPESEVARKTVADAAKLKVPE